MEESKRERVRRTFRPLFLTLPLRHFFSLTFLCVFPTIWRPVTGYLRPSFPDFNGIYSTWASSTFDALLLISAGTDLEVLTFQLLLDCETVIYSFLVFFLLFFLFQFLSFFLDVFFNSLLSLTHSPPNFHLLHIRGNGPFVLLQTIRLTIPRSWLTQRVRAAFWSERLCTDWRFSVMETLAVILNCRWQVKRLKVPFNSVFKENIVFSAKKK